MIMSLSLKLRSMASIENVFYLNCMKIIIKVLKKMEKYNLLRRYYLYVILFFFIGSIFMSFFNFRKMNLVKLYVKDKQTDGLVLQKVFIPKASSLNEKIFWILKELISGPINNKYERILDPNIEIKKVIIKRNIAYISFDWMLIDSLYKNPSLVISSIVNSVLLNNREIEGVKILIEDIEPVSTFCNISLQKTFKKSRFM